MKWSPVVKTLFAKRLAGLEERQRRSAPALPPELVVQVKALACELPVTRRDPGALEYGGNRPVDPPASGRSPR